MVLFNSTAEMRLLLVVGGVTDNCSEKKQTVCVAAAASLFRAF